MSLPWMRSLEQRGPIVGSISVNKKKKRRADIIYPVFLECAELEADAECKEIFINLAHGILPKGFSVRNCTLAYTDTRMTPVRMDLEPATIRDRLVDIFSKKKGLVRSIGIDAPQPSVLPVTWRDVTKKIDKCHLILDYVCSEGRKLGWSTERVDAAYNQAYEWIKLGHLRQNEVTMEKGFILNVACLKITAEGIELISSTPKKNKPNVRRVHISRLYQSLQREVNKKKKAQDDSSTQEEKSVSASESATA